MARSGNREENAAKIKEQLYVAAAQIVAKAGFAGASVSKITARAAVAQGTFYNYFKTREAIFNDLIVIFGKKLRRFIRSKVEGIDDFFDRERIAFEAFFEFIYLNPFFVRVLNEAEIFTPESHREYFDSILWGYREELTRAANADYIRRLAPVEIDVISLILMSTRAYLAMQYFEQIRTRRRIPKNIVDIYMGVVRGAFARSGIGALQRPRALRLTG